MIIGCDTGTKNWAYSKVIKTKAGGYRVLEASIFTDTIKNLTVAHYEEDKKLFVQSTMNTFIKSNPKTIICERFQFRGGGSALIELISVANGVLSQVCSENNVKYRMVIASEWKNHIKRKCGDLLPVLYSMYVPHLIDASMIAMYHYGAYEWLNEKQNLMQFLHSLRKNSNVLIRE